MSCIHQVFLGNKLANVGSGDVELLGLLAGVCFTLGVDYAPDDLTGVVCVVLCVIILGVEVTMH
jgi:hypothetical protein